MKYTSVARSFMGMIILSVGLNASSPAIKEITETLGQEKFINFVGLLEKLVENKTELAKYKAKIKSLKAQTIIDNKKELSLKEFFQRLKCHMLNEESCKQLAQEIPIFMVINATILNMTLFLIIMERISSARINNLYAY